MLADHVKSSTVTPVLVKVRPTGDAMLFVAYSRAHAGTWLYSYYMTHALDRLQASPWLLTT